MVSLYNHTHETTSKLVSKQCLRKRQSYPHGQILLPGIHRLKSQSMDLFLPCMKEAVRSSVQ